MQKMDVWYVVRLVTDERELINQAIIVPSNWVVVPKQGDNLKIKFMELAVIKEEDILLYETLSRQRSEPPASWKNYTFEVLNKAKTYHEATHQLIIVIGGNITLHNSSNNDKSNELFDVSSLGMYIL